MKSEKDIQNEILIALSAAGCLVWRNHVGVFRPISDQKQVVKVGTVGQPDIMAIYPLQITQEMVGQTVGVCYQVEVKTATGRQSDGQKKWQQQAEKRGAVYVLARCVDDAIRGLKF